MHWTGIYYYVVSFCLSVLCRRGGEQWSEWVNFSEITTSPCIILFLKSKCIYIFTYICIYLHIYIYIKRLVFWWIPPRGPVDGPTLLLHTVPPEKSFSRENKKMLFAQGENLFGLHMSYDCDIAFLTGVLASLYLCNNVNHDFLDLWGSLYPILEDIAS